MQEMIRAVVVSLVPAGAAALLASLLGVFGPSEPAAYINWQSVSFTNAYIQSLDYKPGTYADARIVGTRVAVNVEIRNDTSVRLKDVQLMASNKIESAVILGKYPSEGQELKREDERIDLPDVQPKSRMEIGLILRASGGELPVQVLSEGRQIDLRSTRINLDSFGFKSAALNRPWVEIAIVSGIGIFGFFSLAFGLPIAVSMLRKAFSAP
ncbi:hypothetical protein [Methylopila sp. 73B]|uniref:hypothetical protein n=1 Tax=Methylopila sp. 73B TaxID=1120792 RepID=UPI000375EAF9|nr:hypothetical protein [Methylopila sp. 73B]